MKRKRLAALLSLICMVTSILPMQILLAKEMPIVHKSLVDASQGRTTNSQIEIEDEQTTSSAIDTAEFVILIEKAEEISNNAVVGTTAGTYDVLDKAKFDLSIAEAKEALDTAQTQQDIDKAIIKLANAIKIFKESIVKPSEGDVNEDGVINVADIALIAYYYQIREGEESWDQAKRADTNKDGVVNGLDLVIVAQSILNQ
ncbi:MAG: dockerin type I repeat-containing protein [Cellulosilyticaceae bacterium]